MAKSAPNLPKVFQKRSENEMLAEFQKWHTHDTTYWSNRQERFRRDQELYKLMKPQGIDARVSSDIITLNDPKVIVQKFSRVIARHPNIIEVAPSPRSNPDVAQKVENFLYSWDQATNQRWMMGLHQPYRLDQAFYLVLRGWLAERIMIDPDGADRLMDDPSAMWDHQLIDPALVFPFTSGNKIVRVTHTYKTIAGNLTHDPMFADNLPKDWEDFPQDAQVRVNGVYWYGDDSWWHTAWIDGNPSAFSIGGSEGRLIKKPTELGYNPWIITLAKGAAYGQTDWDDYDYIKEMGTGILDESAENQKYLNRIVTKLNELLSAESNPPVSFFTASGQVRQVDFGPGSRMFWAQKDRIEAHRIGPNLNDFQLLWDIVQKRAERATLPYQFFGEYGGESAFSANTLLAAGKDVFFPYAEAVNQADALKYRKVLELYRDLGPSTPIPTKSIPDGMGRVLSDEITPEEIAAQGVFVEVTREEMTPQEIATRINLGLAMLREKAISLDDFRREYVKIKNPSKTNLRVLAEMVYMNEDVIRSLVPMALAANGEEHLLKVWELIQNPMPPPQAGPGGAPGGMPMPQGMQPGAPGQMPQPGMPGMSPEVLPVQMQQGNPMATAQAGLDPMAALNNPAVMQLLAQALGGAGGGGTPPIPGTGSPLMPVLPPGRMPF